MVKFLLGQTTGILEKTLGECMVLTLDTFVLLASDRDVQGARTHTGVLTLHNLFVRCRAVNRRPLALGDVH